MRGDRSDRASLPRIRRVARPTKRLRTTAFTIDPPTPALSRRVALSAPITGGWSPLVLSPRSEREIGHRRGSRLGRGAGARLQLRVRVMPRSDAMMPG